MLKDGRPAEELCFELRTAGYDIENGISLADPYFPPNLPIQTYAPIPGCGAALSIEILDFGKCPLRSMVSRMLVLVNYSSEYVLSFKWEHRHLFTQESELQIEPSSGELSPGSHCIIVFRICCAKPVNVSGEVSCLLDWTHLSSYGQRNRADDYREAGDGPRMEYHAFHSDHVHEPMRTGKAFLAGHDQQHISVANRLTVSRFRHLMSTAAGQKFLNENLHRTALLASHIQTMSPRRAMQASTTSRASIAGGASGTSGPDTSKAGQYLTPPTSYPLYVRIRAVVADWEVPVEKRSEFLIADPFQFPDLKVVDEEKAEKLRTRAAIRGTNDGRANSKKQDMEDGLHRNLMRGTLEYLIREVIEEKSFGELVEDMLAQDAPYFVQYEDTPPPGVADHKQDTALNKTQRRSEPPTVSASAVPDDFDELKAIMANRSEPAWASELLSNFAEPNLADLEGATSSSSSSRPVTLGASKSDLAVPPSPAGVSEQPPTPSQAVLDEAMSAHGEVNLEAFKTSAGEVLDQTLLDVMDDVIAGRLNWQRPLPRVRGRNRER